MSTFMLFIVLSFVTTSNGFSWPGRLGVSRYKIVGNMRCERRVQQILTREFLRSNHFEIRFDMRVLIAVAAAVIALAAGSAPSMEAHEPSSLAQESGQLAQSASLEDGHQHPPSLPPGASLEVDHRERRERGSKAGALA
ncbi:hypothetical protein AC1031_008433 [Aphanomyces cochlioides]|nr:hypothetical protein AC1031_008433 [Aphanomyces cochlioides]